MHRIAHILDRPRLMIRPFLPAPGKTARTLRPALAFLLAMLLTACATHHPTSSPPKPPVTPPAQTIIGHRPAPGEILADVSTDVIAITETGQPMLIARLHRDTTLFPEPRAAADTGVWWTNEVDADGVQSWRCIGDLPWIMNALFGNAQWRVVVGN